MSLFHWLRRSRRRYIMQELDDLKAAVASLQTTVQTVVVDIQDQAAKIVALTAAEVVQPADLVAATQQINASIKTLSEAMNPPPPPPPPAA